MRPGTVATWLLATAVVLSSCKGGGSGTDVVWSDAGMDVDLFDPGTAQEIVDPGVPDATDPGVPDPGSPDLSGQDVPPDAPEGEAGEVVEEQFYPSPELFLKILGPSSDHFAASAGSLAAVTGILFGEAESITWSLGSKSGVIEPQHYWLSDAIPLDPGDNRITVTATGNGMTATDSILLVHTPGFLFTGRPVARPDVAFVGTSVDVVFTLALGQSSLVGSDTVDLYGTQADGSPGKKIGTMKDDGDTWDSGDEIPGDGLFTLRSGVKCGAEGSNGYRVGLTVKTGVSSYVAYSPPVFVDCVAHVYQSDCQTVVDTQKAAQSLYESKLAKDGEAAARAAVADFFKTSAVVKESGLDADGYGLWAYYKSGILGVLSLAPAGLRAGPGDDPEEAGGPESVSSALLGGDEIASKRASLFSPFFGEFGVDDETQAIEDVLSAKSCPTYDVSGPHSGTNATLSRMRASMGSGIVAFATHGDTFFSTLTGPVKKGFGWSHAGSQEVLFTGEPVACSQFLTGEKSCSEDSPCPAGMDCIITSADMGYMNGICIDRTQADLRRGRVAVANGTFAVLPSFFEWYGRAGMPESLVYLGACRSVHVGTLAAAFIGSGAKAVAGFTGYVSSKFAGTKGKEWFGKLVSEDKNTGDAFPTGVEDPAHAGSFFRLIGAHGLVVTNSHIINDGFERGDLTGWTADGDGRVITKLGITKPVTGKFMAIISTGLGYTTQVGSIDQTFCLPADTYSFSFYWKFYSEEFHEWCGSEFQDTFKARLFNKKTKEELSIVDAAVDDLCDPDDCGGCCDSGKCVGLIASDVSFDQGDAWVVPKWQKAKIKLLKEDGTTFGGNGKDPVTLSFFCTDKGDSIYDTVVLVDTPQFK